MHYIRNSVFLLTALLGASSCGMEAPWSESKDEGTIKLELNTSSKVFASFDETRADNYSVTIPDAEDFKIRIEKKDGTLSKTFNSVSEFEAEESFPIGEYTIEAFYGDIKEEGFNKPYFYGKNDLMVYAGSENRVSVDAKLANAMIIVAPSELFKKEFPTYSVTLHHGTSGKGDIVISGNETRPVYMTPGNVEGTLTVTNSAKQTQNLKITSFTAQAQHRHNINLDIKDGTGHEAEINVLTITFDNTIDAETINIPLSDELFNGTAPEISSEGFANNDEAKIIEGNTLSKNPRFKINCSGGMAKSEVWLRVSSQGSSYMPAFGSDINLMKADASMQAVLAESGIEAYGFFKNPDKMGIVDLSKFITRLTEGKYEISMDAVDAFQRKSNIVLLKVNVTPLTYKIDAVMPKFMAEEMTVTVNTNSIDLKDNIEFLIDENTNGFSVVKPNNVSFTSSGENKIYTYHLPLTKDNRKFSLKLKALYRDRNLTKVENGVTVNKILPGYKLEADAFSTFIRFRVQPTENNGVLDNTDVMRWFKSMICFYKGGSVSNLNIINAKDSDYIYITGLSANSNFSGYSTYLYGLDVTDSTNLQKLDDVRLETADDLKNGDFSESGNTINLSDIQTGGQYTGTLFNNPKYSLKTSIEISEPKGWATINSKTCYAGSSNKNTWFLVPSTYLENGSVTIRSVGYNHAGTTPSHTKETAVYYSKNAPDSEQLNKAAGELFLGSYSFDGSENRTDGVTFNSRPTSITFDYSYSSLNGEKGQVIIELIDYQGEELTKIVKDLDAVSELTKKKIDIKNYPFNKKASLLKLKFLSSNAAVPSINIPKDDDLKENAVNAGNFTNPPKISANSYKAVATGSVLKIDNVKLGYEFNMNENAKSNSKNVRRR